MRSRRSRTVLPHALKNFFQARLPHLVGDGRVAKCVAQDTQYRCCRARARQQSRADAPSPLPRSRRRRRCARRHGREEGSRQCRRVGVAVVPAKSFADGYEALSRRSVQPAGFFLSLSAHRLLVASKTGRSARGGRLSPLRICSGSSFSSAMVRRSVLRCMLSSRAALHWFPL